MIIQMHQFTDAFEGCRVGGGVSGAQLHIICKICYYKAFHFIRFKDYYLLLGCYAF